MKPDLKPFYDGLGGFEVTSSSILIDFFSQFGRLVPN
jgi:hypothetical protein